MRDPFLDQPAEDRVARVLGDALPPSERQAAEIEALVRQPSVCVSTVTTMASLPIASAGETNDSTRSSLLLQ